MKKKQQEILPQQIWEQGKIENLKEHILSQSRLQSKERKLKNELLAIQYKIEDYIESVNTQKKMEILDFVKMYLQVLNTTQKSLAALFEMPPSNLHKYLVGDRRLNKDLVLKLSSFSHVNPEYWLRIEVKNELFAIKEEGINNAYKKYDYRNLRSVNTV